MLHLPAYPYPLLRYTYDATMPPPPREPVSRAPGNRTTRASGGGGGLWMPLPTAVSGPPRHSAGVPPEGGDLRAHGRGVALRERLRVRALAPPGPADLAAEDALRGRGRGGGAGGGGAAGPGGLGQHVGAGHAVPGGGQHVVLREHELGRDQARHVRGHVGPHLWTGGAGGAAPRRRRWERGGGWAGAGAVVPLGGGGRGDFSSGSFRAAQGLVWGGGGGGGERVLDPKLGVPKMVTLVWGGGEGVLGEGGALGPPPSQTCH